jgi:hypothetical protein
MPIEATFTAESSRQPSRSTREFAPEDRVMVSVPMTECKFLATWGSPYQVLQKMGPVNYLICQPGRRKQKQMYHVNLLTKWISQEVLCGGGQTNRLQYLLQGLYISAPYISFLCLFFDPGRWRSKRLLGRQSVWCRFTGRKELMIFNISK